MVGRIESRPANPVWDLAQDFQPIAQVVKLPFAFDTIQSDSKKTAGFIPAEGKENRTCSHHHLESPQFDPAQFKIVMEEVQSLMPKVAEKGPSSPADQESRLNETLLFLLYIACMKAKQESSEQSNLLSMENAQKRQESNRTLQQQFFQTMDEKINRSKAGSTLSWVGWALWGAIAAAGVASVAISIATGGAALPTVMVVANAALSVGQGSVQITQGVLNYKNNQSTAAMVQIESERYLNTEKIRKEIQTMKEGMNEISEIWKQLIDALNNQYQAAINQS